MTKALSLRQQMAPKSIWKVTSPINVKRAVKMDVLEVSEILPIGTLLTIQGKFTTHGPGWSKGFWFRATTETHAKELWLCFDDVKGNIELSQAGPEVAIFVLYDTARKEYYGSYDYNRSERDPQTWVYTMIYSSKLTQAKKYKRLADVRASMLVASGYYENLPATWGSLPDWMQGGKAFDVPRTWVIHKIDKLSKKLLEEIELLDTFDRSWKLRTLTLKYGPATRTVYSDLEKKKKLEQYTAIVIFNTKEGLALSHYIDEEVSKEDLDAVNEVLANFDKKTVHRVAGTSQIAVGVKDYETAVMLKLSYTGNLIVNIIDLVTMTEKL